MRRELWSAAVGAALAAAVVVAVTVVTDDDHDGDTVVVDDAARAPRTLSVTGEGTVTVRPDTADVTVGVQVTAATADVALQQANDAADALIAAVKGEGVDEADIRTTSLYVYPMYSSDSTVSSYTASNMVTVTVRDIDKAGAVIDAAAGAASGAISISGISFSVDDTESALDSARTDAIENARARADQYAAAAGVEVGDVLLISETSVSSPPIYGRVDTEGGGSAPTPIESGSQELSVSVSVVFALG
ncbi:MAG: SIMPL domain-containing protein [Ilumatobacteraceae bacterium]